MKRGMAAVPLAVVCLAACQEDRQRTTGTWGETTDSGGIEIVENARPPEGSRLPWRIGPEPSLSIGAVEGEDPYMLGAVADAVTLPGGRIAVADRDANEVRVFDASATHLGTLGRMGEGAGEFRSLSHVAPWPGDSIVAWEQVARRISVFDSLGNFGRSFVLHCLEQNRWRCPRPQAAAATAPSCPSSVRTTQTRRLSKFATARACRPPRWAGIPTTT